MLNQGQIFTLLLSRMRGNSLFSKVPIELIKVISNFGQDPNSDIAKALHHAAYARKEDVEALLGMLDKKPRLLLEAGNVQTPGGNEVRRVTLYEFLLGAGDAELAGIVQGYFAKIDGGEQERIRQYERFKPHIEGMLTQKPYDLVPLIELIKKATPEQVAALLNKDMTGENELCKAVSQFRKDWAPKVLNQPCMHYNYASLQHAVELLDREWDNLYKAGTNNYNKINLVWRQVIGFEMRRLPGIDRCVMEQGLYYVINKKGVVGRSYAPREARMAQSFPVTATDDSIDGLGWDFSFDMRGGGRYPRWTWPGVVRDALALWKIYVEQKFQTCRTYAASPNSSAEPVCNTLSC